jgi:protein-S-isoprenylcysteine O-methyltransferase Ste14
MLTKLGDLIAGNRILLSRIFAVAFAAALLATESAHEGRLTAAVLFLSGLVLVALATVGRLWCSLYLSGYKNSELITTGPYSVCRNPLYFFSFLGFAGIGFATETVTFAVLLVLAFALFYPIVIEREEQFLRERFGQAFEDYCARTPRFFPRLRALQEPETYLTNPKLFRRTMGDVLWFVWLVGVIELVEALHNTRVLTPLIHLP